MENACKKNNMIILKSDYIHIKATSHILTYNLMKSQNISHLILTSIIDHNAKSHDDGNREQILKAHFKSFFFIPFLMFG